MGNTPTKEVSFRNAAASGDVEVVRQCMQAAGRERLLSATTGFLGGHKTVLHIAAKHGNAEVIAAVLGPLVDAVTTEIVDGVYPGTATQLLGKIANQQDGRGRTPLLTACFHGQWDCAELLLEAGSNAFAADKDGNGLLHLAAVHGHVHLVQQLLEKAEAQAITGRLAAAVNLSGFTALHYAAWAGSSEIVRLLLVAGMDQMQSNWDVYDRWLVVPAGSTPLHTAALHHHSGACLVLLQSFARQLREWLPGDPVPTDPRTRRDNKGELPVDVAIRTGLHPTSQLALCLQPSVDILSIFDARQLDDMRRRGPPPLRVIAAEALRTDLLRRLGELQGLQQRQIEEQLRQQLLQQRRRRGDEEEVVHGSSGSWQRWWSRNSIDRPRTAAATAAVQHPHTSGSSYRKATPADGTSKGLRSPSNGALPSHDDSSGDHQHAELVHRLHRTPSITLGAVQYANSSPGSSITAVAVQNAEGTGWQHHSSKWEQLAESSLAAAAAVVGKSSSRKQLTAPAGEDINSDPAAAPPAAALASDDISNASSAAAATAAPSAMRLTAASEKASAGDAKPHRVLATASITLGYLDRVWTLDKMQQQQHEQSAAATSVAAPATPGLTVLHGSSLNSSSSSTSSSRIGDSSLGEVEASEHDMKARQQHQQQQQPGDETAGVSMSASTSSKSSSRSGSPPQPGRAAPATPAATASTSYQHINDHIHRSTGLTSAFALVNAPCQPQADKQQHVSASSSSCSGSSIAGDQPSTSLHSKHDALQQQQQRSLHTSSITLAELDSNQSSRVGMAGYTAEDVNNDNISSNSNHGPGPGFTRQGAYGSRTPQLLLERAGIKGKSWEQFMTPRSWLLYQQQRESGTLRLQQQQPNGGKPVNQPSVGSTAGSKAAAAGQVDQGPAAGNTSSSSSSSSDVASSISARRAVLLSHQHRSPHRRSFELPGATAGMSAMFGANRHHVSRMLREAGAVDPKTLYRTLSHKQGSLAVATSLAGALPGCVSETLVQVVDVSRSLNPGALLAGPGLASHAAADPALFASNITGSAVADGLSVGSSHSEVCAICADKAPAVGLAGCGHLLCFECTKCIVGEGVGCRPPLCPFCRRHITGFGLVAATAGGVLTNMRACGS